MDVAATGVPRSQRMQYMESTIPSGSAGLMVAFCYCTFVVEFLGNGETQEGN
jgi:hypothetical protein